MPDKVSFVFQNFSFTIDVFRGESGSLAPNDSSDVPITEIVGGSVAGFVLIIVIMVVAVWCRRKKNSKVVIENNEMYGPPADYDQYDKDAYDTKVLDNNDYYYES